MLPAVAAWGTPPPASGAPLPPPLSLKSIPLPVKLAGGLFLFGASAVANEDDRAMRQEILRLAEDVLRADPLISMELGPGIEAGGIFASVSSLHRAVVATTETTRASESDDPAANRTSTAALPVRQMSLEFQLNGGNSWAQARVSGIRYGKGRDSPVQLISLGVANMDASLNGGWAEVTLPKLETPPIVKYVS